MPRSMPPEPGNPFRLARIIPGMRALAAVLTLLAVAGCAGAPPSEPSLSPPVATPEATLDAEAELERVIDLRRDWGLEHSRAWVAGVDADPGSVMGPLGIPVTREELVELERMIAEGPVTALTMYGARNWQQFGGMWVNEPGVGTVMLFTADLERHRQAIAAIARGRGFEVRHSRYTEAELRALQQELVHDIAGMPGAEPLSVSVDVKANMVHLEMKSNDPGIKERLEAEHAGRLRVTVHPLPGPWQNAAQGPGWRLLAAGIKRGGEAYVVRAATDQPAWHALWADLDQVNEVPAADLETEIVVAFLHGIGSSCPEVRLDEIVIDHAAQLVYSVTSDPLAPRACTADLAGSAFFVVALARDALPDGAFTLALTRDPLCGGCPDERIEVELP